MGADPTTVTKFATEAEAEAWITRHKIQVQSNAPSTHRSEGLVALTAERCLKHPHDFAARPAPVAGGVDDAAVMTGDFRADHLGSHPSFSVREPILSVNSAAADRCLVCPGRHFDVIAAPSSCARASAMSPP